MNSQPSSAIENGLTAQLMNSVTPMPRQCRRPRRGGEVDLHQHRDDHQPDQHRDRQVDLGDLQPADGLERRRETAMSQGDADDDAQRPRGSGSVRTIDMAQALPIRRRTRRERDAGRALAIGRLTEDLPMRRSRPRNVSRKACDLFACSGPFHGRWIRNAPVCGHRLAGPVRADLTGGVVADGEDEVQLRRAGCAGRTRPRTCCAGRPSEASSRFQQVRVRAGLTVPVGWLPALNARNLAAAEAIEDGLGEDAARRIARAQEEHVVGAVHEDRFRQ
jgi:hypothetical protein